MLTKEGCKRRRKRLFDELPEEVEWVVIADPRHVNYFSAFFVNPISFSTCERALLILERSGKATLLADNFTRRAACTEPFVDRDETGKWYDHQNSVRNRDRFLFGLFKDVTRKLSRSGKGMGLLELEWLPAAAAHEAGLDTSEQTAKLGSVIRDLRRRKEVDEISLLEQCMRACEAGHEVALDIVEPEVTELDVYRAVQSAAVEAAGRPAVVYGDFRTVNAFIPKRGGLPTSDPLVPGDLLILDYSVLLDGYRSDFTNTIAVGTPTEDQQRLFDTCVAALHAAEAVLAPGTSGARVYEAATRVIEDAGYPALPHHAGHGIGLGHPEPPILVPASEDILLPGDVVTLEPGSYIDGVGGVRVEHNYLITADGCRRLSNHQLSLTRD
jgi:Xaa-Pro aminopeptidase